MGKWGAKKEEVVQRACRISLLSAIELESLGKEVFIRHEAWVVRWVDLIPPNPTSPPAQKTDVGKYGFQNPVLQL